MDAGLGGGIGRVADVVGGPRRALARAGAQVDDPAVAPFAHVRGRLARAQEGRAQVQPHDEVPVLDLGFPDVAGRAAAHVVDQDVEAAVRLEDGGEQRLDRCFLRDVGDDGEHGPPGSLDLPLGLGESRASMSARTSDAPSSLSRSAMARPRPAAAPVTRAILPATLSPDGRRSDPLASAGRLGRPVVWLQSRKTKTDRWTAWWKRRRRS